MPPFYKASPLDPNSLKVSMLALTASPSFAFRAKSRVKSRAKSRLLFKVGARFYVGILVCIRPI